MSVFGRVVSSDPEAGFYTGADAGWADAAGASFEEARAVSSFNSDKIAGNAVVERIFDKIREETGQEPEAFSLRNPYELNAWELFGESVLKGGNAVTARQSAIRELETRLWALGGDPIDRGLSIDLRQRMRGFRLDEQRSAYRAEKISVARETLSRADGFTRLTAPLAGGVGASFTDPTQVALGAVSGGTSSTVLGAAVREAAVSVALEGILQPVIASNYADAGESYTARDAAFNLGAAALFGGAIGGGGKAGERAIFGTLEYRQARQALDTLPDDDPLKLAASPKRRDVIAAGRALAEQLDEAGRQALDIETREIRDLDRAPAGRDVQEHAGLMKEAMTAAEQGVPPPLPPAPRRAGTSPVLEEGFTSGRTFTEAGRPVRQQSVDIMSLTTDAGLMQYKGGADADGVTARLKGVQRWSAIQSGELIVWERTDGTRIVADGHQRTGLGRRLVQSGAEEAIAVNANVLRETDGWSAADVRAIAAKKNIAEGSGDVMDAAQVFRDRPDIVDESLPVTGNMIADARAIASLSDAAYGMARNGVVRPDQAALVGRYAARPETQGAIIEAIADTRPANATETRILIGQMLEAGFRTDVQESLFGLEQRELSMLKPKMQLVSAVVAQLRADKRVFSLLEREADRIEAAGNALQRSENSDRALTAAQVEEILVRLATRKGPVSDRLNAAAAAVASGETNRRAAADALARDMSKLIEEEGFLTDPSLDMRKAARLERAREQGFDVDQVLYHGTAGNFDAFDKAKIGQNFPGETAGFFFTNERAVADNYARERADITGADERTLEVFIRKGRVHEIDVGRQSDPYTHWYQNSDTLLASAVEAGADSVRLVNKRHNEEMWIVLDPKNIRSTGATFRPGYDGPNLSGEPSPAPNTPPVYDRSGARVFDDPDELAEALEADIDDQTADMFGGGMFGTVPDGEGGAARDWKSGVDRIEKMQDRFKECVGG